MFQLKHKYYWINSKEDEEDKVATEELNLETEPLLTPGRGRSNLPNLETSDFTNIPREERQFNLNGIFVILSVIASVSFLFCLSITRKMTNQVSQISDNNCMASSNFTHLHESQEVLLQQERFHIRREQGAAVNDLVEIQI